MMEKKAATKTLKQKVPTPQELKKILHFTLKIIFEAGELLLKYEKNLPRLKITSKSNQTVASSADLASELFICSRIQKRFPDHLILSEEMSSEGALDEDFSKYKSAPFTWIIDPLDGTHNYLCGLNFYAICISLVHYGLPVVGVVYRPSTGEVFQAVKGGGAMVFNRKIKKGGGRKRSLYKPTNGKKLHEAMIVPGSLKKGKWPDFEKIARSSRGLRKLGSAALELCYVASGMFDVAWDVGLAPWDMAAPALICQEAGVRITTMAGEKFSPFQRDVFAARRPMYQKIKNIIDPDRSRSRRRS